MNPSAHLEVGYVSRVHGLQGEIEVRLFDPSSTIFEEVQRLAFRLVDGELKTYNLESSRDTAKGTLVTLEGIFSREEAETLQKSTVFVFREELEPPDEDEVFQGDLIGLEAKDEMGRALGNVAEVWNHGPTPNLVIRGPVGEVIVPFIEEFVLRLDLEKGQLVVRPPEFVKD